MSDGKKTTPPSSGGGGLPSGCTTAACSCSNPELKATIIEIKGLYKPGLDDRSTKPVGTTKNSGYQAGYISSDNKGRIFTNRALDGKWSKDQQYIELTVQLAVTPSACPLPPGTKVKWTIEDPDDPTNEPANVHLDAGQLIDPNDYTAGVKTGANASDNDPRGKATPKKSGLEQVDAKYALTADETLVDPATMRSAVRLHVSDIAGDNYIVQAVGVHPSVTVSTAARTGVMTVWHRIEIEYVKMASADEIPVDQIAQHYNIACVQVDVSEKRVMSGASDKAEMGANDGLADAACYTYTSAAGEFKHEKQGGWFCMVAANRFIPGGPATILFEGNAEARGNHVRLPAGTSLAAPPKVVRVFDAAKIGGLAAPKPNDRKIHIKFPVTARIGRDLTIAPHDFHLVDDPDNPFLDADLSNYGFTVGTTVPIQVLGAGEDALVIAGISPTHTNVGGKTFFEGKLLVFTKVSTGSGVIVTLCHELGHAFDNAHKCGNWDWEAKGSRTSCCMNYWFQFVLDNASPRAPIKWTQDRQSAHMCGPHIVSIRDYHLEDNPGLGW